ncbi:MAG: hypothetical protein IKU29_10215 [Parabacteroides sp.]|nr:hypothetical protein [Parabacteroides sp.]
MSVLDIDHMIDDDTIFIEKWLQDNCIINGTYSINDDGIVDVDGDVILSDKVTSIDIQFGTVSKSFSCARCKYLKSLEGSPESCMVFSCSFCTELISLKGCPKQVKKTLNVNHCHNITSLDEIGTAPTYVLDGCSNLSSLKGLPYNVTNLFCDHCTSLTSLEGCSNRITGALDISYTGIKNFKHGPKYVNCLRCRHCDKLESLVGFPIDISIVYLEACAKLRSLQCLTYPQDRLYIREINIPDSEISYIRKHMIGEFIYLPC